MSRCFHPADTESSQFIPILGAVRHMATHLEKNLQQAIELIRDKVLEMARRDHRALMDWQDDGD